MQKGAGGGHCAAVKDQVVEVQPPEKVKIKVEDQVEKKAKVEVVEKKAKILVKYLIPVPVIRIN
eukprot:5268442-Amphidinium_carterae.1